MPSLLAALAAVLLSFLLTLLVRRFAPRLGLTDNPDAHRKLHDSPVPLGGGIAVFLAAAAVLVFLALETPLGRPLRAAWVDGLALLAAGAAIVVLGLIDDRWTVRGIYKLAGQILIALILVACGLSIRQLGVFGYLYDLGILAVPFTVFWLVGAMNAINLLDGIDGLAATLGIILSGTLAVMALLTGQTDAALIALVFAAALAGFLVFNFPPASIFLGDAGSMLIGLVVGVLALKSALKGPSTVLLAAPLAVWTLPVFDSAAAILRRKLTGRSIYTTDRAHLQHRLLDRFGSNRMVIAIVVLACAATGAAALVSVFLKNDTVALVASAGVVAVFIASDLFGRAETALLVNRVLAARAMLSQSHTRTPRPPAARVSAVRLQGTRHWELLWETLTESAERLHLSRIRLDLNLPSIREGYNAVWQLDPSHGHEPCWHMELPLVLNGHPAGSLHIAGHRNGEPVRVSIEKLLDLLEPFESQLAGFTESMEPAKPLARSASEGPEAGGKNRS